MIDRLLAGRGDGTWDFPADWGQGRATFGGLVAGAGVRAMDQGIPTDRSIRFLQTVFAGPVPAGAAAIDATTLREGGSMTLREARIAVDGSVRVTLTAGYGKTRDSGLSTPVPTAPDYPAPSDDQAMPYLEGITPVFTQYARMIFSEGGFPFTGGAQSEQGGWVRFPDAEGLRDAALITALLDVWPCPVLQQLSAPRPASTMAWTVHFHDAPAGEASAWCRYRAVSEATAEGYHTFHAWLWDAAGRPLASATQHVAVFG